MCTHTLPYLPTLRIECILLCADRTHCHVLRHYRLCQLADRINSDVVDTVALSAASHNGAIIWPLDLPWPLHKIGTDMLKVSRVDPDPVQYPTYCTVAYQSPIDPEGDQTQRGGTQQQISTSAPVTGIIRQLLAQPSRVVNGAPTTSTASPSTHTTTAVQSSVTTVASTSEEISAGPFPDIVETGIDADLEVK